MRLMQSDMFQERSHQLSSGKTSPAYSTQKITPLVASLLDSPEKVSRYNRQGKDGQTLVLCLAPKEQSHGASSMPNISEWPNDADVCLLSQVLETVSIPQRYFLSPKACAGILRRAEKRGKKLPKMLGLALQNQGVGGMGGQLSQTLDAVLHKGQTMPEKQRFPAVLQPIAIQNATRGKSQNGIGVSQPGAPQYTLDSGSQHAVFAIHGTQDPIIGNNRAHALGLNGGQENVLAFSAKDYGGDVSKEISPTLRAGGFNKSHANSGNWMAVCGTITAHSFIGGAGGKPEGASAGHFQIAENMAVRRLIPVECERLQGFPDNHTNIPYRNKPAADGPRYKAIGNSWAVPVVTWIGERIAREVSA